MRPWRVLGWCLSVAVLASAVAWTCWPRPPAPVAPAELLAAPPWFADVTDAVGLRFTHDAGPTGTYFMPQALGSGAALFDCDGDGRLDIYLLHNGGPRGRKNQLFRQDPDGRFLDISAGSGLDVAGYGMGVAVGDVNNDGRPDVLITEYAGIRLFLNLGGGKFKEVTREAGLENPAWGASAAFVDYNRDGWLDLVVVNYVDYDPSLPCNAASGRRDYCAPRTFHGRVTRLFRNRGPRAPAEDKHSPPPAPCIPTFEDVTAKAGLGKLVGPGLGVVCADFDGDGWPDIFIANDGEANRLWINQKDGTFQNEAIVRGVAYNGMSRAEAGMGVALGDVNGDELLDLFVTHLTEEKNTLWLQGPRGLFRDGTGQSGLSRTRWHGTGFGTVLGDFDHDGHLDLAVGNGRVSRAPVSANPQLGPHWGLYAERNQLFAGDGTGRFRDLSPHNPALCGTPNVARGLACGDIDGDGALDLLVTTAAGRARLYRNVAPGRGHWLMVRALEPALRRDAYGACVHVQAGKRTWLRQINPGSSYLCSNDPRAHFGLGAAERVAGIEVVWPNGDREKFDGCATDRVIEVRKGEGPRIRLLPRQGRKRQGDRETGK